MARQEIAMKYLYIINVSSMKGSFTDVNVITPEPKDDRATLFTRIYKEVCAKHDLEIGKAGIAYFYLEPLELEKA